MQRPCRGKEEGEYQGLKHSMAERRAVCAEARKAVRGQILQDLKTMLSTCVFSLRTEEIYGRIYLWKGS